MNSISDFLDKFYKKIPGSYWAIMSGIFGLLIFLIASILHSMTEPVSFFTHTVSHLGWGPNGSQQIFTVGLIILGFLFIPYTIFLSQLLWTESGGQYSTVKNLITTCALLSSGIAIIGLIFTALFGDIRQEEFYLHVIGAGIYFTMALLFIIFYNLSMLLNKKWNLIQLIMTLIVILSYISMFIVAIPPAESPLIERLIDSKFMMTMSPNEKLALVKQMISQNKYITFFEWMTVLSTCVWFIATGIHTLKFERPEGKG